MMKEQRSNGFYIYGAQWVFSEKIQLKNLIYNLIEIKLTK